MARKPKLAVTDTALIEMDDAAFAAKREALMVQLQEMEAAEKVREVAHASRRRAESLAQRQSAFATFRDASGLALPVVTLILYPTNPHCQTFSRPADEKEKEPR